MGIYWLSFADGSLPKGVQFLGACMVRASNPLDAVLVAHAKGINPGGEVQMMGPAEIIVPPRWMNRLLSREECEAFDAEQKAAAN